MHAGEPASGGSGDLAQVVDAVCRGARALVAIQGSQVLHAGRLGPTEGMPVPAGRVRHSDDLTQIIDSKGLTIITVGQNAYALHPPVPAPKKRIRRSRCTVRGAYHLTRSIDRVSPTLRTARQRAKILHATVSPEDGMCALDFVVGGVARDQTGGVDAHRDGIPSPFQVRQAEHAMTGAPNETLQVGLKVSHNLSTGTDGSALAGNVSRKYAQICNGIGLCDRQRTEKKNEASARKNSCHTGTLNRKNTYLCARRISVLRRFCSRIDGRQQKRVILPVDRSPTRDLTAVVDRKGELQRPTRIDGNQIIQVLHARGLTPDER